MFWDDAHYDELLDLLRGHVVGLVVNSFGNWGDQMIARATQELFARHDIEWRPIDDAMFKLQRISNDITLLAEPGGGNLGTRLKASPQRRKLLAAFRLPKIILPQTAADPHEDLSAFRTVFAREVTSWRMLRAIHPDVRLVPDLALTLRLPASRPDRKRGEFLRTDLEATIHGCDPVTFCNSLEAYLALAGRYEWVVTNRLHFGIAAMLQGYACTFRANNYHKNRSFYETWLKDCPMAEWEE